MAIERRLTEIAGPVGREAAHRPLAQRPGGHRRGHARARSRPRGQGPAARADADPRGAGRAPPRLGDARLHPPAAGTAGLPLAPPAGALLEAPPRSPALQLLPHLHGRPAARRGRAGRRELRHEQDVRGSGAGLRGNRRELDGRGVEPGFRARLPRGRRHLLDPPVAARRGDRALVEPGVRLLRGGGRLHARGRASCRRRRTRTPRSCCAPRRRAWCPTSSPSTACSTACRSPTTRTSRRTRSRSSTPWTRSSCACARPPTCSTGITFHRERMAAAASDEFLAATDVADALVRAGRALPRGSRNRRRAWSARAVERGKQPVRAQRRRARRAGAAAGRLAARSAAARELARVEGLGGRHLAGPGARSARAGPARARRGVELTRPLGREFYARPVHEVARDLIGCIVQPRRYRRPDRRDRDLPRVRARLSRPRRPDRAHPGAVRPAGPRLRLPLVRRPRAAQCGRRGGGRGVGGADPGARAARGPRPDAGAARSRARARTSARARASSRRRSASGST